MNYRHIYMLIIEHAKKEIELGLRPKNSYQRKNFPNQYFEFHHILPKSLFPLWAKRKSNIVPLTAREHFFCHQLLIKIWPGKEMIYALFVMTLDKYKHRENRLTSREYENLRKNYRKLLSKIPRTIEWRQAISKANLGKKMSKEACQKMSQAKKGKTSSRKGVKLSDEIKRKISENSSHHESAWKGKHIPEDVKNKIRKTLTGRKYPSRIKRFKCLEDNFIGTLQEICAYYNIGTTTLYRSLKNNGFCKLLQKTFIKL